MRPILLAGKISLALLILLFPDTHAAARPMPSYQATVVLSEPGLEPRPCGRVAVSGGLARLDVLMGEAGMFRALIRPDQNSMYLLAEDLRAYAAVPVYGDETGLRELALRVADSLALFGFPLLSLREDGRQILEPENWNGYRATKIRGRFVAELMGLAGALNLITWENDGFAPFPLRVEEIRALDDPARTGNSVELADIRPGDPDGDYFSLPEGYTRHSSVLELILYALAGQ